MSKSEILTRRKIMELNNPFNVFLLVFIILNGANVNALTCSNGQFYNGTDCEDCGITFYQPNIKIVGGQMAVPHSWPSQVLLEISYKADVNLPPYGIKTISASFQCGGTLINHHTVLTAAHCNVTIFPYIYNGRQYIINVTVNQYYPTWESMLTVYLGLQNLDEIDKNAPNVVVAKVSKTIQHPNYDDYYGLNDISLYILDKPVKLNNYIQFACLPKVIDYNYPSPNVSCYAAGWGALTEGGATPNELYNVKLTVYESSWCSLVYPSTPKNYNAQICAGNYSGYMDTCQGDSGGGLYVYDAINNNHNDQRIVVGGIVSYGDGCANPQKPGIYTRVSYYLPWILSNWKIIKPNILISGTIGLQNSFVTLNIMSILAIIKIFF